MLVCQQTNICVVYSWLVGVGGCQGNLHTHTLDSITQDLSYDHRVPHTGRHCLQVCCVSVYLARPAGLVRRFLLSQMISNNYAGPVLGKFSFFSFIAFGFFPSDLFVPFSLLHYKKLQLKWLALIRLGRTMCLRVLWSSFWLLLLILFAYPLSILSGLMYVLVQPFALCCVSFRSLEQRLFFVFHLPLHCSRRLVHGDSPPALLRSLLTESDQTAPPVSAVSAQPVQSSARSSQIQEQPLNRSDPSSDLNNNSFQTF